MTEQSAQYLRLRDEARARQEAAQAAAQRKADVDALAAQRRAERQQAVDTQAARTNAVDPLISASFFHQGKTKEWTDE